MPLRRWFTGLAAFVMMAPAASIAPSVAFGQSAAPSRAGMPEFTILNSGPTLMTSSSGHQLSVAVDADSFKGAFGYVHVEVGTRSGVENHVWNFPAEQPITLDDTPGNATVALSPAEIGSYGQLDLTVTSAGEATTTPCTSKEYQVTRPVTVAGTFSFKTMSTGPDAWGNLGSPGGTVNFSAPSTLVLDYGDFTTDCIPTPCPHGLQWQIDESGGHSVEISAEPTDDGSSDDVVAIHHVALHHPQYMYREDFIKSTFPAAKLIRRHGGGAVTGLAIEAGKHATGTELLKVDKGYGAEPQTLGCGENQNRQVTSKVWIAVEHKAGVNPLTWHEQVFGNFAPRKVQSGQTSFQLTN